jgi:hypothetical protein
MAMTKDDFDYYAELAERFAHLRAGNTSAEASPEEQKIWHRLKFAYNYASNNLLHKSKRCYDDIIDSAFRINITFERASSGILLDNTPRTISATYLSRIPEDTRRFADAWKAAERFLVISESQEAQALQVLHWISKALQRFPDAIPRVRQGRPAKPGRGLNPREGYPFDDEYDIQDLLWVFLKMAFPSTKDEDPTPRSAGTSSSVDFVLPDHKIGIEAKYIRKKDNIGSLKKQLLQDINDVSGHSEIKYLVFFLVEAPDATGHASPLDDLERREASLSVTVIRVRI